MFRGKQLERLLCRTFAVQHDRDELLGLLRRYNDEELFSAAIENATLWRAAELVLHERTRAADPSRAIQFRLLNASLCGPTRPYFYALPHELRLTVLELLNLRDLQAMAATCRFIRSLCDRVLEKFMEQVFRPYNLSWQNVRFMLTVTGSVVSGLFAFHLAFLHLHKDVLSRCRRMDIYVSGAVQAAGVELFLGFAGGFTDAVQKPSPQVLETVIMCQRGGHGEGARIDVHRCRETPLVAVLWQPLTCLHTWMSGSGLFVGYPDLSLDHKSMVSHSLAPLRSEDDVSALSILVSPVIADGVELIPYHIHGWEDCGTSATCPSVLRTSADALSFHAMFRAPGPVQRASPWWGGHVVHWNLGSMDCSNDRDSFRFTVASIETSPEDRGKQSDYVDKLQGALNALQLVHSIQFVYLIEQRPTPSVRSAYPLANAPLVSFA
ncbi:hypothetical protein K438DRAFT_1969561 [Mycena galopus ATCC 62051]|nr:hypothetical protein K438DRAFT_1969561 [Mycena galopus ATCC 62051]